MLNVLKCIQLIIMKDHLTKMAIAPKLRNIRSYSKYLFSFASGWAKNGHMTKFSQRVVKRVWLGFSEVSSSGKTLTSKHTMVGWNHRLNGYKLVQAPGDGEGEGSLVCCSPWGHEESDTTE